MVGIVLVAHSRPLAEALAQMARQVAGGRVPIVIAAGAGPGRQELGTDAAEVTVAIQAVAIQAVAIQAVAIQAVAIQATANQADDLQDDTVQAASGPQGVLVLVDLGSALLSAELAVELLPPEFSVPVRICPAPLVEGATAAAVQAGLGSDLETVCRAALGALDPKRDHLSGGELSPDPLPLAGTSSGAGPSPQSFPNPPGPAGQGESQPASPTQERILTLTNTHGLHARPAARFVQMAAGFVATVQVRDLTNGRGPAPGNSLNALTTLGAVVGHRIAISASGPQAAEALDALAGLVQAGFSETPADPAPAAPVLPAAVQAGALHAVPVSEGVSIGPLFHYRPGPPPVPAYLSADPQAEWDRLEAARQQVRRSLQARRGQVAADLGEAQAAIFAAHLLILDDPLLVEEARQGILDDRKNAAAAWYGGLTTMMAEYQAVDDAYLRDRAADVLDVGKQVLAALAGEPAAAPAGPPGPAILLAEELNPGQLGQLDPELILGLVTLAGGPTSHTAILARSLGIPAVTGAPAGLLRLPEGTPLALDGSSGAIWVDPPPPLQAELSGRRAAWQEERRRALETSRAPAATRDGRGIEVAANAGSLADARSALRNGADGIGVLRTEFLFLNRATPPEEDEQVRVYRQVGEALEGRPVIVRTLDVGGDKTLPYLERAPEANPYLGVRGLRLSLRKPDLFRVQLRAILRAAAGLPLQIMFPMVTDPGELQRGREQVLEAHAGLAAENLPHAWPVPVGMMVEVPAAALNAAAFAPYTDFYSIGTNDLTQYTLAAERGNPQLVPYADALHPAVLRLIRAVVEAGQASGKWVGVCGEIAADRFAVPALVGLGVNELSLNPAGIPHVKAAIRGISFADAQALAERMLSAGSAPESRKLAIEFFTANFRFT